MINKINQKKFIKMINKQIKDNNLKQNQIILYSQVLLLLHLFSSLKSQINLLIINYNQFIRLQDSISNLPLFQPFNNKLLIMTPAVLKIFFFSLILVFIISRQVTLQQYIKNQQQSKYYVFHTYASKLSQKQVQHFPQLQKLIFTTPWNPHGNQLTIQYAHKLDYVIPCWYQIAFKKQHILIDSDANYNQTYISLLRKKNPNIKILPRVSISGSKKSLIQAIGTVQGRFKRAVSLIATLINKQDVDGLVIDTPHNLFLRDTLFQSQEDKQQNTAIKNLIVQLVNSIRINLYKKKLIYFHIPNPTKFMNQISNQRFVMLHVDGFMVQAFDSIQYDTQLKNAILWAKLTSNIKVNAKYFIVLPFFSRRQRQGIKTTQIFKALQTNGFIYQNIQNSICTFVQAKTHVQSYVPCFSYFKTSFQKIKQNGFDVGFWEAGDGLQNYFLFM